MTKIGLLALESLALFGQAGLFAEKPEVKPPENVSYYKSVRPIVQQHCQGCHQPAKAQGGYVMTSHALLMKPGDTEQPAVVPGHPEKSSLYTEIISHKGKPPKMPKGTQPLLEHDVALIAKWIRQGAKNDTPVSARDVV